MKNEIISELDRSANIVQELARTKLSNGKSLADLMSIDEISLWRLAEPTLALHVVPNLLKFNKANEKLRGTVILYIRMFIKKIDSLLFILSRNENNFKNRDDYSIWVLLGFSDYMYRDVIKPIIKYINLSSEKIQTLIIRKDNSIIESKKRFSININVNRANLKELRELKSLVKAMRKEINFNDLRNISIKEDKLTEREFNFLIKWLFLNYIPQILPKLIIARRLMNNINSKKLIITCDIADSRSRLFCLLAKNENIPILELQFGSYEAGSVEWRFSLGDNIAVWGQRSADILEKFHGVSRSKLKIIGSPRFDYLMQISNESFSKIRRHNGIAINECKNKIILFASSYTIPSYNRIYSPNNLKLFKKKLFEISGNIPNLLLLVKPHPLEKANKMKKMAYEYKNILILDPSEDIREYIPFCDAFITLGSTSTYDALLSGKRIISPNIGNLVWWDDVFIKENISKCVEDYQQLGKLLMEVCNDETIDYGIDNNIYNDFIRWTIYKPDGQAAERVVRLGNEMKKHD